MVEVFKTNVEHSSHAEMLINEIHQTFENYSATFDLEDCDRVLRVKSSGGLIESSSLIGLLKNYGFHAEILPDEVITTWDAHLKKSGLHLLQ